MSKKILELKRFLNGIVAAPSDSDIPEESPSFSKNIDAISEEGKLKAVKGDLLISDDETRNTSLKIFKDGSSASTPLSTGQKVVLKIDGNTIFEETVQESGGFHSGLDMYYASYFIITNANWPAYIVDKTNAEEITETSDIGVKVTELASAVSSTDITIEVDSIASIIANSSITLKNVSTNVTEDMDITSIDTQSNTLTVEREGNATFDVDDEVYGLQGYNLLKLEFDEYVRSVEYSITNSDGTLHFSSEQDEYTESLDINPHHMILINDKEEDDDKTYTNIVVYDKNAETNEAQLKIVENFYEENGRARSIITNNADLGQNWGLANPEKITINKGANSLFIGTGGTTGSVPKWFGKIEHKPFNNAIEGYHLEDARLKPLDEDSTVLNVSYSENPVYGANHNNDAAMKRTHNQTLALSESDRSIYWIKENKIGSETDDVIGNQYKSNTIGFIPSAMCTSEIVTTKLSDTSSVYTPWVNGSWETNNSLTNVDSQINGHVYNDPASVTENDPYVRQTYSWVASKDSYDQINLMSVRFIDDGTTDGKKTLVNEQLAYFKLDFNLTTTAEMNTHLGSGKKITRKPPLSARISDLYEKNGTLYIQYYRTEGFTHYDEWLFSVDLTALNATTDYLNGDLVDAKPITPNYVELKEYAKDYRNTGKKWFTNPEVFDASKISSRKKVYWQNFHDVYSNRYRWRATDCLGFLENGKHVSQATTVDGVNNEFDEDTGWYDAYAKHSISDQNSHFHGWEDRPAADSDEEYESPDGKADEANFGKIYSGPPLSYGKSYGFKQGTYNVTPAKKGLTNYRDSNDDIGVLVYLEGEQLTTDLSIDYESKTVKKGIRSWHKYKWMRNLTEPEFKSYSEWVIMSASKHNYGALQRSMADGGSHFRGFDSGANDDLTHFYQTIGNEHIDGATTTNWSAANLQYNYEDNTEVIDGRIIRKKAGLRMGSVFNNNSSSGSKEAPSTWTRGSNRTITPLQTSATSSSQPNVDLITKTPPSKYGVISVSKGFEYTPSNSDKLSGNTEKTNNKIYITGIYDEVSQNDTAIHKWNINSSGNFIPSDTTINSTTQELIADTTFGPLFLPELGTANIKVGHDGTFENAKLFTTRGDIRSGAVKYNNSGVAQDPGESDAEHSTETPLFFNDPGGELDVDLEFNPIDPTDTETGDFDNDPDTDDTTRYKVGSFNNGSTYQYKMALVYDSFQEGPLSKTTRYVPVADSEEKNFKTMQITLNVSNPPKRVSHITIYRRNDEEEFFRLVTEVGLEEDGWSYNSETEIYTYFATDNGTLGAHYEAVTGMPEDLEYTIPHYSLSTEASGTLIVGDCWHPEIKQAKNFLFKSQPQSYSNFNWSKDYCVLPNRPTAIQWFAGKLYAFDLHNMWRINVDTMVIEDAFEGIGCIGPESIVVTDLGMYFADYQGIYDHNGNRAENISRDISHSSAAETLDAIDGINYDYNYNWSPWQNIAHKKNPHLLYDPKDQSVLICFTNNKDGNSDINAAWKFSVTRKRWDFLDLEDFSSVLTGNQNDIYLGGQQKLIEIGGNKGIIKPYSWTSKSFNMGSLSESKNFLGIKFQFNTNADAKDFKAKISTADQESSLTLWLDETKKEYGAGYSLKVSKNSVTAKIKSSKQFKKCRFDIQNIRQEIDSITLVYRNKSVKV